MIYQGTITGTGTWTQIDATPLVTNGTLINTIAHSTMGNLVVGNYDTSLVTGNAFIYNMATTNWINLNPGNSASVTAYGIWQNGGSSSTSYTIAGGLSTLGSGGLDEGYLVNYDSVTGALSHYKTFNYDNEPVSALVSHFDGITATTNGFNLTGFQSSVGGGIEGGFFASVTVLGDGSFSDASWTLISNSPVTTGNTVISNSVLGIYVDGGTHSFVATVPEPGTTSFLVIGIGIVLVTFGVRRKSPIV